MTEEKFKPGDKFQVITKYGPPYIQLEVLQLERVNKFWTKKDSL